VKEGGGVKRAAAVSKAVEQSFSLGEVKMASENKKWGHLTEGIGGLVAGGVLRKGSGAFTAAKVISLVEEKRGECIEDRRPGSRLKGAARELLVYFRRRIDHTDIPGS